MHSPDENQQLCPGQSLWSLITEHVSESELQKVHAAVGQHLVDMYTDLYSEAEMWHKMCLESQQCCNHGSWAETPFAGLQCSPLADPPAVKELVRAEVKMLLQTLEENVSRGGRDVKELLVQYKPETVHYALSHQQTHYSNFLNSENTDNAKRRSSQCSVQSSAEEEIESIRDKLNVTELQEVVTWLRSVFQAECDYLTIITKHLKQIFKQKLQKTEPSLIELKDLRAAIQKDLNLLPSSLGASSSPPVKNHKDSFRLSAGQRSDSPTVLSPPSVLRQDSPFLNNLKPRPPSQHPPNKTSLSRTYDQHRVTSACTSKPLMCNRMDTAEKNKLKSFSTEKNLCLNYHINAERNTPSPKNPLSLQCCIHRQSTGLSPQRERKSTLAWNSQNINAAPSSASALGHFCEADSSSSVYTEHSVSTKGKLKGKYGQQTSNSGESLTPTQGAQSHQKERRGPFGQIEKNLSTSDWRPTDNEVQIATV